jgi:hypothetical protein
MKRAFSNKAMNRNVLALIIFFAGCTPSHTIEDGGRADSVKPEAQAAADYQRSAPSVVSEKTIHVLVALCDNLHQGIVPVPGRIGNGDDPQNNLYWGARFGVKTFFSKAADWVFVASFADPKPWILERCVFRVRGKDVYMVADAYRGSEIRRCIADFLSYASTDEPETVALGSQSDVSAINAGGTASLIAFVGHNGLMDFSIPQPHRGGDRRKDAMVLCCASKPYFKSLLGQSNADPLLWTTGLMAPESYVLKAALDGWVLGEDGERIRLRAADAYNKYQRCGLQAARRLFATGG